MGYVIVVNILIIGGTGFIGPYVVRGLVGAGHHVAVFHRGETTADLPASVIHIQGARQRLYDFVSEFQAFAPQTVLDMCAYTEGDARVAVQTFRGLANRLVCLSSMDVYRAYGLFRRLETGTPHQHPFDEDAPLRSILYPYRSLAKEPNDLLYGYEKILVEQVVMNEPELAGTALRLPQVYGPNDKQHRLAGYLDRMDKGQDILMDEAKAQWRWTRAYVEDVAFAIVLAVTNEKAAGRVYNVGERQAQTESAWVKEIGRVSGWRGLVKTAPKAALPQELAEPYDWRHDLAAKTSRIREELGFLEIISLEKALERTVAWERASRSRSG